MRRRLIVVIIALAAFNAYVALGILSRSAWAQQHATLVWFSAAALMALEIAGPIGDRMVFPILRDRSKIQPITLFLFSFIDWFSYLALGLLSCLFIYVVMADIGGLIWKLISFPTNLSEFDERMLLAVLAATGLTMFIGVVQAISGPTLRRVAIPISNLPTGFDGFTIAQISDLHIGPIVQRNYVEKVVSRVNALKPDIIVLTGDFVDGSTDDLREDVSPLAALHAPHGKVFVMGNHEYYWGEEEWIKTFRALGLRVLLNEHEIIRNKGAEIILAGITDYSVPSSSPKKSLEGAPKNLRKILLAHQPASYQAAYEAGFDLQISGHTHGGQYFPFNLIVKIFQRYVCGLNCHGKMWIYVSAGTGYWGPPLRTGIPSEITLIRLISRVRNRP